ncbi:transmembrane channel-like protein 8 isoform X2 [Arvicola amphibius]|uniref:transmembrane channel-like protein 8 isoform X2 n=1 Tax=Arvicola amphibius TaxID=1047088 RepID=UPI0018E35A58|nr:transmembrane channel-like protein 8 isoform X2 [Arvicola amphibius]
MFRQWSVQSGPAPRRPGSLAAAEELWEEEVERLCASREPVRMLPYAMADRRFIRELREPEGVKTSCRQRWCRRGQVARQYLREAAQKLAHGFGLWEGALYEIGGLFGTGIQSYFTFLRFLLLLNLLTLLMTTSFILLPLVWLRHPERGPALKLSLQCSGSHLSQSGIPKFHNPLWNILTGRAFNNTYLFYGAYRAEPEHSSAYSIRLAYLLTPMACLLLCFCGTLQRMVQGLPQQPLLGQGYRAPLSAKVFSSWDFCIRVWEAATIKKHEISNELKVELEEGRRLELAQQQTRTQKACHLLSYLRTNVLIALLVVGAISAIFWATKYSQDNKEESLFLVLQYLPPGIIALVNFLGPQLFTVLIQLENFPPSTEVNLTLIWCVVLKLASLGMFSFSLGQTVLCIGRNKTSCETYGYNACEYQCWENSVGEELYKLIIFNFLLTVAFAFLVSLPRRLLVERFSGWFWTWLDREEFLVPKNVLDIVAAQTVTWMGLFYCPLLPLLNSIFLFLTFYIKKYTLLRNSRASPRLFRASSSTFFFQLVLLLGLLLAVVPLAYVISSTHSSWDCGLFTNYSAPWQVVPELVTLQLPLPGQRALRYLSSHAFSFPLLVLLRSPWPSSLTMLELLQRGRKGSLQITQRAQSFEIERVDPVWWRTSAIPALGRLRQEDGCEFEDTLLTDLVLTVCVSQSRANARAIQGLRKQLVWQVQEKWHLVDDLSRLLPELSPEPESPRSRASRPRSFCPGFPCPGSPGPRTPRLGPSTRLSSSSPGAPSVSVPVSRFHFPSRTEM